MFMFFEQPSGSCSAINYIFGRIYAQLVPVPIKLADIGKAPVLDFRPIGMFYGDLVLPVWVHDHFNANHSALSRTWKVYPLDPELNRKCSTLFLYIQRQISIQS